jgi:hypothetical protein
MKGRKSYAIYSLLLIVIVFIGLLAWSNLPFLDPVKSILGLKANITSGEVIEKIRAVSHLTTTKYTIRVVARSETPGTWWILGQDYKKMLMVAKGTVEAGFDLYQLNELNVSVSEDGKNITVTLPPVMILNRDYCLSNTPEDTYVYNASSGLFANTTNQQTQLREAANNELVISACKANIMGQATIDAKTAIEGLLKTLGPDINVTFSGGRIPSVEECIAK